MSRVLLIVCAISGADSSLAQNKVGAPPAAERPRFDRYHAFLWMKGGPPVDAKLFSALAALGVSGTNVAGTAPSAPHGHLRVPFYVDHTAGKGTLFLDEDSWQAARPKLRGGAKAVHVRPRCLSRPEVLESARERIREVVTQARPHRPAGYSLDDEISLSRRNNPADFCFSDATLDGFRRFLRTRYGTGRALAEAWGIRPRPLGRIVPLTTGEIRRRELVREPHEWNLAPWADHREYMDELFADVIGELADDVRRLDPGAPVGFTGGEAPSPFSGVDWARMLARVDFVEPYDIGGSRELVRSFARPGTVVLRTLFRHPTEPAANRHELWDYFLRGDQGVIIWSAEQWFEDRDAGHASEWAKALAPTLRELASEGARTWMAARPPRAPVAVLESAASNRLHWMMDSRLDGRAWINRTSSYEIEHSSQSRTREAWQKLLEDLHFDYEHITPATLDDPDRMSAYRVLILPRIAALSERSARAVRDFARTRCVIADAQAALFDEKLTAYEEPPLDELFGITRRHRLVQLREAHYTGATDPRHPAYAVAEPGLELRSGLAPMLEVCEKPVLVLREQDAGGRTAYLNLLLTRYLDQRRDEQPHPVARDIEALIQLAGVTPIAEIKPTTTPIRLFQREHEDATLLALLANVRTSTATTDARSFRGDVVHVSLRVREDATVTVMRNARGWIAKPKTMRTESGVIEVDVPRDAPVVLRVTSVR